MAGSNMSKVKVVHPENNTQTSQGGNKLRVVMFLGTTREGRYGIRVAKFMKKEMEKRGYEVELFDPVEMPFPLLEKPLHFYGPERKGAPDWMLKAEQKVKEADAFLLVSAEYNHSIPPALSNMLDHFPPNLFAGKPSGIVCYSAGMYGGMRSAMQLRVMTGELGCISVSNIFGIPQVQKALKEDGTPVDSHMVSGAEKHLEQLKWMALAMKNHRDKFGQPF